MVVTMDLIEDLEVEGVLCLLYYDKYSKLT